MKLKTATVLAAATQLLSAVCGIFVFARMAPKLRWPDNADWFVEQPLSVFAQIMLAVFLFVLVARQKST